MKKILINLILIFSFLASFALVAQAYDLKIVSPTEEEIMPGRDFYVVGTIDRGNSNAKNNPLNIKVELLDSKGNTVRTIGSNVSPDGLTSASYFLTDYESGSAVNDNKGALTNSFTPPDIVYDGSDRDTIRNAHNKIVVKEDYFAAIIYGGATKQLDLKYEDEHGNTLKDIEEGNYTLKISAINFDGETVCTTEKTLNFANTKERFVASKVSKEFVTENNLIIPASSVGFWRPEEYVNEKTNNYQYFINARFLANSDQEYTNAKRVGILLNYLYNNDVVTTTRLGGALNENSSAEVSYYYYDIGEEIVSFEIAGTKLVREGVITKADEKQFVKLLRAEHYNNETGDVYPDFDMSDGVILSETSKPVFYGVFTPIKPKASANNGMYSITNSVSRLKAVLTNESGNVLRETIITPGLVRDEDSVSKYEFSFTLPVDFKNLDQEKLLLKVFACDLDGNVLAECDGITVKLASKGNFITGYDDTYWGKAFCDMVNTFGPTPSGDALTPDQYITRGDFAAMVNNLFGLSFDGDNSFTDLDEDSVFYEDCITAQGIGYMTGDEHGRIKADDLISREQAMIILSRISNAQMGNKSVTFFDQDEISFWAKDSVNIMVSNGIVTGFEGYLHPTDNITCAEAAALIIKTIKWSNTNSEEIVEDVEDVELGDIDFDSSEYIDDVNFENLELFFSENKASFDAVANYLMRSCKNGVYVGKVGAGLEIRDYVMGNFVRFSDDAVAQITTLSSKFAVFSIKYNPKSENAIHFVLGKDENNQDIGLTYTTLESVKGKELTALTGNWYYFEQN